VIGVVELDDKSHERDDRSLRDQLVDRALADARIPVIHFPARKGYAIAEVRAKLAESFAIGSAPSAPPVPHAAIVSEKRVSVPKVAVTADDERPGMSAEIPVKTLSEAVAPVCPKCESAMVIRQATKGPHAGKFFWACSSFPKCRKVVAVGGD